MSKEEPIFRGAVEGGGGSNTSAGKPCIAGTQRVREGGEGSDCAELDN